MTDLDHLLSFIREDAPLGDITSEAIIGDIRCRAVIITKEDGVIAGLEETTLLFQHFGVIVKRYARDGDTVIKGTIVMELDGLARSILLVERTGLNIIGRMSGIATRTRIMATMLENSGCSCRISATRKTAPGLRALDKRAVVLGGGDAHRTNLSDGILIKDNHLALVPLEQAVRSAKQIPSFRKVEVEVLSPSEAVETAAAGADILLLDNMTPDMVKSTLTLLKEKGLREGLLIEISGGITEENLMSYALPGVDFISSGALTHSVRNFDISLEIIPESQKFT
ncbi:MAG: carboxylating nicotinate-nucleotide diphosphorylase [Methanoregulaceae archaeon]|nr:carboxylating nicotinate-nucleotide diphosphorylase [Methanoregulaceae archaeon]